MLSLSHGTPLRASAGYVLPGSSQPYAAAVKKPRGAIFPAFCTFPVEKDLHPARLSGLPLLHRGSPGKNTEERLIFLFICGTVHFPGSASPGPPPPPSTPPPLQPLFIMEEKTGVHAKEKACFRTVQDKFQGFRPVVLDLRQKYARLSLSH